MHKMGWAAAVTAALAVGQTQVDLRTQSRAVDFSGFNSTKPISVATSLPASCGMGQMIFLSNAPAGQNLYGCTGANTWTVLAGGGAGSSGTTVQSGGTVVGTSSTLDFASGQGIVDAVSSTGSAILIQTGMNTAVTPTLALDQAGTFRLCASASGSTTAYTCSLSPTLTMYTPGMILEWKPDLSSTGGSTTLNVDFLGATSLKLADGLTDPAAGDIVAGQMSQIWYDGSAFRLLSKLVPAGVLGEAQPACAAGLHGRLWFVSGVSGVKDSFSVCAKDATNTYAWRTIY